MLNLIILVSTKSMITLEKELGACMLPFCQINFCITIYVFKIGKFEKV